MAIPAVREPGPLVILLRLRTVEKVLSMGIEHVPSDCDRHHDHQRRPGKAPVPRLIPIVVIMPPHTTRLHVLSHSDAAIPIPSAAQHLKSTDSKIDVMRRYLDSAARQGRSQVAAIGVAQEPQRVFITRQRDTDRSKPPPRGRRQQLGEASNCQGACQPVNSKLGLKDTPTCCSDQKHWNGPLLVGESSPSPKPAKHNK
ncbi:hypothetical protein [Mycobacterium canetti]|uniref:hypothetical protein n=1 Tax=Mycobacterium canetti TaxID=78331 RepID=UPI000347EE07|nr:hypothetical protein [Mycobacterium canetti]MBC9076607.1 hypothetical protein [Mycobacterium canetti]